MKALKVLWPVVLGFWTLLVFLASNGPSDVQTRAEGWLNSPLLRGIPVVLLEFASSRLVIALTALLVGLLVGWKLRKRLSVKKGPSWHSSLATDMAVLAHNIDVGGWRSDLLERLNADLLMVCLVAKKNGLAFPGAENGFKTLNDFLPYLHRVSALLRGNEIETARHAADELSKAPPDRSRSFIG